MTQNRVFVTGDTHCPLDIGKLHKKRFTIGRNLNKKDIVIICGDAGFIWDEEIDDRWITWISNQKWTTIFCDGNHDNHDLLKKYPVVNFHGAKAHKISDSLFHIMRGEIMELNGKSYFFFGGGFSHDIFMRTEHKTWWQDELPVLSEINNALNNLSLKNNHVDYIITHDAPYLISQKFGYSRNSMECYDIKYYDLCKFFDYIKLNIKYKNWFLGHYHMDIALEKERITLLYSKIVEIN